MEEKASTASSHNSTWQNRAELSIAHGALTNSKRPECLVKGIYPTHLKSGNGPYVRDTANRKYVDFICGLGSNLLGYAHPEITNAIHDQAGLGASLSLGTTLEVVVAEKVKEVFPFIERLRFLKTGTDACNAAVRIARAYRGKGRVLSEGYHGWGDEFVALTPPALGVYSEGMIEKFTDLAEIDESVAAVIVEPVITDDSEERVRWLRLLRQQCDRTGALLIFDEVITGFRYPGMSVSRSIGIAPDLICLGKAMGNGMPISVVGGRSDVMNCGEYFISSTFAGETLSLAAALKTMSLLQTKYRLEDLWAAGAKFQSEFNRQYPEKLKIVGYPTRGVFQGDDFTRALFFQEACKAGLLFGPSWFISYAHLPILDSVAATCGDILARIRFGHVRLEGEMPKKPFAQKVREK
jgi:glutamate-1-semialdehyde 2,1-aminomutase